MGWFDNLSFSFGGGDDGNSFSFLPSVISAVAAAYTGYKSYESQRDASELQYEAAQSQVRSAGFQEQAAAKQEMAALESQRLAELNAIDAELQSSREVENTRMAQAAEQSEARARAAASGLTITDGSTGAYLGEKADVAASELDWLRKTGQSKVTNIRKQGETAYMTGMAGASTTRAQAAATRAGARGTEAQATGTMAGAYGTAGSTINSLWNIGRQSNWF